MRKQSSGVAWGLLAGVALLGGCAMQPPVPAATAIAPPGSATESSGSTTIAQYLAAVQYIPTEPRSTPTYTAYFGNRWVEKSWADLPREKVREMLPIQATTTTIRKVDSKGNVSYLIGEAAAQGATYQVTMEWSKYRIEPIKTGSQDGPVGKVGVGVRLKSEITDVKGSVNINGLFGIAAAAQAGQLNGRISVEAIGIDADNLVLPVGLPLNESTVQQSLQVLAAIQTRLYEPKSLLTPHIIAVEGTPEIVKAKDPQKKATEIITPKVGS